MKFRLLAATALVAASSAYAADNMTVKDGTGATKVLAKKDVGSVLYDKNIIVLQSDVTVDAMAQIDGHIDGVESLLSTETANTSAISGKLPASLGSKTGATSLSVVSALDGFSVQCTSGCNGGTQYQEDAAAANADLGTVAMAVRKATPANTSGADGDYEALQVSGGRLWTDAGLNIGLNGDAVVQTGSGTLMGMTRSIRDDLRTLATDTTPMSSNITQVAGATIAQGNGTAATAIRVALPTDGTGVVGLNAGTNTIGATFGFAGTATTTITRPADTSAYTANDAFADSTTTPTSGGFTLSNMCRISGGSGILTDATFVYSTSVAVAGTVFIYDSAPTAQNDNAAWSVSDSDQLKLVGTIPFATVADGANAVHNVQNLNIGYTCSGSANLRFMVKITTGYTPASADTLTIRAKFIQSN